MSKTHRHQEPWVDLADWMEYEQQQIDVERTSAIAERELTHLLRLGADTEVKEIIRRIEMQLPPQRKTRFDKIYETNAERQKAYRDRKAGEGIA